MKTDIGIQNLAQVLENLKTKKRLSFDDVCDLLFTFKFEDFDQIFKISAMEVPAETYIRLPVLHDDYVVFLKIWGIKNYSIIRDHCNYDAKVKVLKGSVTEVNYRENSNFIEYDSKTTFEKGAIFIEEQKDINSIINNSEEISVTLHIYRTSKANLEGVRVFDTEKRKIGFLSKEAKSCTWNLPEVGFQKIIEI